jgi:hypothetical protein
MRFSPIKTITGTNNPPEIEAPENQSEPLPVQPVEEKPSASSGGVVLKFNEAKNGLQLHFPDKPSEEIRAEMKAVGWRWSFRNACWYHRDTPENRDFAEQFVARLNRTDAQVQSSAPVAPVNLVPLPALPATDVPAWRLRLAAIPKD